MLELVKFGKAYINPSLVSSVQRDSAQDGTPTIHIVMANGGHRFAYYKDESQRDFKFKVLMAKLQGEG